MASVLNPVHHPRIWFKEACTLAEAGYKVFVLGRGDFFSSGPEKNPASIPYPFKGRSFTERLKLQVRFMQQVFRLRPDIVHIHTPELSFAALICKIFLGFRLVYDRHEDYPLQVQNPAVYSGFMRVLLPRLLRFAEKILFRYANLILIAEAGYKTQVPEKAVLIRNSFIPLESLPASSQAQSYFLISGTLSERYGIQEACALWEQLYPLTLRPLIIAGHCLEPALILYLKDFQTKHPGAVTLTGITQPVSYTEIQTLIRDCFCGLSLFRENIFLKGKIPSRFYEFMGLGKPFIMCGNPEWENLHQEYAGAIYIYPDSAPETLAEKLLNLPKHLPAPESIYWTLDAGKLIQAYQSI